jgi:hypothetical protein
VKKKISILSLITVFFVATTSLPISIYFCQMTDTYSLGECPMNMHSEMQNNESCTPVAINDIHGTSISNNCCSVKTVDSSIKDHYLNSNNNANNNIQILAIIAVPGSTFTNTNKDINKIYFDTSPPLLSNNSLYLTNSILLI